MRQLFLFFCFACLTCLPAFAQDSNASSHLQRIQDSLNAISDSILNHQNAEVPVAPSAINTDTFKKPIKDSVITHVTTPSFQTTTLQQPPLTWQTDTAFKKLLSFSGIKEQQFIKKMDGDKRIVANNDIKFYVLLFLLFFLGIIKTAFPRYFSNLFSLSFQSSFRQLQTREQLMQISFPAFMLNLLFIISAGYLIALSVNGKVTKRATLPEIVSISCIIVAMIYMIKYAVISIAGWMFNVQKSATEYRFIVFFINKILGIVFLPLLLLLSFDDGSMRTILLTIALSAAIIALVVRYIISMSRIRNALKITTFHFFVYFCCIEVMPLLVIYKAILIYADKAFLN